MHGDAPREPPLQTGGVDAHLVAERERHVARHLEALVRIGRRFADQHFVGGGAHRARQIRRHDLRVGHFDVAHHRDLTSLDGEVESRGGVNLRFGNVRDAQIRALHVKLPVGQRVTPGERAPRAQGSLADMRRARKVERIVVQFGLELRLAQREVHLEEIQFRI